MHLTEKVAEAERKLELLFIFKRASLLDIRVSF